jgi:anaerobic selenocysteine-containing dehydrogenase
MNGFWHALGASRLLAGTVCDTCCETAWDLTLGPVGGTDPETVVESDLIISWGADLMATNVHFWAKVEHARKAGVPVIVIDPRRSKTAERADWHIPIRIGTDAALALGVMHVLVRDGLHDRAYLSSRTLGFEKLEREILPRFPPVRVAEITGLSVEDVERFAIMYGKARRSFLRLGEGMTRLARGGQALRAVAVLPALTGAYGRRGGGALLLTYGAMDFNYNFVRKPSGPASTRYVNHLRLGEELLNLQDPPIMGLFVSANNPAITCPEVGKVRRGLGRDDLFTVVHDPFMTATARYADIILPATTYLETDDFFRAYGTYYVQYGHRAVAPQGEAWSNFKLAQALATRMGLTDPVFQMSEREIVPHLLVGSTGMVNSLVGVDIIKAGPIKLDVPDEQEFRTASGKLEIYSEELASRGVSALPNWEPDPEEEADAQEWPLRLLTAPSYFQPHTAYSVVSFLKRREGPPFCTMNPVDATARALIDGQRVRLFNNRGTVALVVRISDEVQPGVVLVLGQRPDVETIDGNTTNILCSDRYTDIGEGATYQSTFLDVEAWHGGDMPAADHSHRPVTA